MDSRLADIHDYEGVLASWKGGIDVHRDVVFRNGVAIWFQRECRGRAMPGRSAGGGEGEEERAWQRRGCIEGEENERQHGPSSELPSPQAPEPNFLAHVRLHRGMPPAYYTSTSPVIPPSGHVANLDTSPHPSPC